MKMTVLGKAAAAALIATVVAGCADDARISRLESDVAALKSDIARTRATVDKAAADSAAAATELRAVMQIENRYHRGAK